MTNGRLGTVISTTNYLTLMWLPLLQFTQRGIIYAAKVSSWNGGVIRGELVRIWFSADLCSLYMCVCECVCVCVCVCTRAHMDLYPLSIVPC